jgi:hypothetical protein
MKKIVNRNKKQETYQEFQEEKEQEQEKEKENQSNAQGHYKRLRSRSSSSVTFNMNQTIHKTMYNKNNNKNVILKMTEIISDYPEKYCKYYLRSELIKIIKNSLVLLIHPIIIFFYFDSVTACPRKISLIECMERLDMNYYFIASLECFICAVLISIYLVMIILRIIYWWHCIIVLIELILFISLFRVNDIYNNGLFSFKLLMEFMLISFAFFFFLSLIIY